MTRALRGIAIFGGLVVLLSAALFGAAQSPAAKRFLARELSRRLSGPGQTVHIEALSGWIPFELGIGELQILDSHGPWLIVHDVFLQWRPMALLRKRIRGKLLTVRQVDFTRTPTSDEGRETPTDRRDWSLPNLPMPIILDRFLLHQVVVEAPVSGMPLRFAAEGSIAFREADRTQEAVLKMVANHDNRETLLNVQVTLDPTASRLQAQVNFSEHENGWLASRLDLKNLGTLQGKIHARLDNSRDPPGTVWIDDLEFTSRDVAFTAQGGFHPSTRSFKTISYKLSVADLAVLKALTDFSLRGKGTVEGTLKGSVDHLQGILTLRADSAEGPFGILSGTETGVEWALKPSPSSPYPEASVHLQGKTSFHPAFGGSVPVLEDILLEASATLSSDGTLELEAFRISSRDLGEAAMNGRAHFRKRTAESQLSINLFDLSRLSFLAPQPLKGDLRAEAVLGGSWDNMTVQTTLEGNAFGYGQAQWTDWHVALHLFGLPKNPSGQLTSRAASGGAPCRLFLDFAKAGSELHVPKLSFGCQDASMEGALRADLDSMLFAGFFRVSVPRLEILAPVLNQDIRGALEGSLDLMDEGGRQQLQGNLTARSLIWGGLEVHRVGLSARMETLSPSPRGMVLLEVHNARRPPWTVSKVEAAMEAGGDGLTFSSQIEGTSTHPFSLNTAGTARLDVDTKELNITAFSGTLGPVVVALEHPAHISIPTRGLETSPIRLRIGDGRLAGRVQWVGETPKASVEFQEIPLNLVQHFGGPSLEGRLNAKGALQRVPEAPQAEFVLKVDALRSPAWPPGETLSLKSLARADAKTLRADAEVDGLGPEPTRAGISVPIRFHTEPFELAVLRDKPVTGGTSFAVSLERIGTLLDLDVHRIQGLLRGQLDLGGTLERPAVKGDARLEKGRYAHEDLGILLQDMTAIMEGQGAIVRLQEVKASDGKKGNIHGFGQIRLDPQAGFPYEAALTFDDVSPLHRDDISGNLNGRLSLSGSAQQTTIKGSLRARPLRVRLPERLPPNVVKLDVEEIGEGATPSVRRSRPSGSPVPHRVFLDIALDFPGMTTVSGWGLESEWQGALKISGEAPKPVVTGGVHIVRGHLMFLTKRFFLTQGDIIFYGDVPPDPVLNVLGEVALRDMTAQVHLYGRTSKPELTLDSRPERPQDEILAQILFGRSATTLSPFQALRLASVLQSLASISSKGSAFDVLGKTRDLLGFERLELLGLGAGEGLQVGLGKYLGENVRVDVNQRLEEGDVSLRIEVEVSPNITLETQVGTQSRTGAGVFWKYDY